MIIIDIHENHDMKKITKIGDLDNQRKKSREILKMQTNKIIYLAKYQTKQQAN